MTENHRVPENVPLIGGGVLTILAYGAGYRSVIEPFIPGGDPAKFQVALIGLILLAMLIILLYQIDTRRQIVRKIHDDN